MFCEGVVDHFVGFEFPEGGGFAGPLLLEMGVEAGEALEGGERARRLTASYWRRLAMWASARKLASIFKFKIRID